MPRFLPRSVFWRGLCVSLAPTLAQLLVAFPEDPGKGLWGLGLGALTPVVVIVVNAVWGWVAALWLALADDAPKGFSRLR